MTRDEIIAELEAVYEKTEECNPYVAGILAALIGALYEGTVEELGRVARTFSEEALPRIAFKKAQLNQKES